MAAKSTKQAIITTLVVVACLALAAPLLNLLWVFGSEAIANNMPMSHSLGFGSKVAKSNNFARNAYRHGLPAGMKRGKLNLTCDSNCARTDASVRAQQVTKAESSQQVCAALIGWGLTKGAKSYSVGAVDSVDYAINLDPAKAVTACVSAMHRGLFQSGQTSKMYSDYFYLHGYSKNAARYPVVMVMQRTALNAGSGHAPTGYLYKMAYGTQFDASQPNL